MTELKRLTDNPAAVPIALAALVAVGGVIRFIVAGQDLFADELATYWIVKANSLPDAVEAVGTTAEISPPLGFILTWLTTPISSRLDINLAPELIRLPALIAGIASIPLVYAIGTRTVGRGAGLLAAALTTLSPFMIFYSAEARGYGVMMAFVLLSTLSLLLAIDRDRRAWWAAYAVFACLAVYTHYTSIFVLGAQLVWAFWVHPGARKPLLIATAAAVLLYVPWLPSLKEDLDSPTTQILSALSPFDLDSIRLYIEHWTLGYPFATNTPLSDLPGIPGLGLIAASILVGMAGLFAARSRLGAWFAANDRRIVLIVVLALAAPVGEAVASLVGTNVFSTRNLAVSWPYLALAGAALTTVGNWRVRLAAAMLAVAGFGFGAAKMVTTDYGRPDYSGVARFVTDGPGGVLVDSAAVTPGPLTNFDIEASMPGVEVFRLNVPEQKSEPFDVFDQLPEPADLAGRVVAAAGDDPITVVAPVFGAPIVGRRAESDVAAEFIALLPPSYELVERRVFSGFFDLGALVFEKRPNANRS
ncbi:MAG: glycosyltransferase family 39 protein [Thermoleophilia bacterium]|nr:glycosyltransferase family 39 protein [Thermoleophilia bacterium]